jgi:pyruvate,water dikinase
MRRAFQEFGMPADTLETRFVHGFMYTRLRPLIAPDKPSTRLPPLPVLKLAVRLHPEMRRRAKRAAHTLRTRPWRRMVAEWSATVRPRLEAQNSAFGDVELAGLDDAGLAAHLDRLLAYCRDNFELHFYLHAFDLGPIGLLLADCERWAITPEEVVPALAGASPSTSAPAVTLSRLRRVVAASGSRPGGLDEVRAISPEAASLLDDYLRRKGPMMVTRYDLDGRTLNEQPEVVLATILEGCDPAAEEAGAATVAAALRQRVPAEERTLFDERLSEARASMDLRDDNGPNAVEMPVGLLRGALLEGGRRLAAGGRIGSAEHVFELEPGEVVPLVRDGTGPGAAELAERAEHRRRLGRLEPPPRLGPEEPVPPLEVLAPAHRALVGAIRSLLVHLGMAGQKAGVSLRGAGVGTTVYRGRARVADSPEAALAAMEPGDVLVVRFTTPAYNTILTLAGALVTADGALLSHAAVMARELGIPAVVGASGALRDIPDGARIEVDPVAGAVRVLDHA